ncbi:transglycosylase SLT domain-containing protein [Chitinispirillales bacterium ANBcel5]|uniref:lytic transglycosylase domain-containing protein n=1 Tax=Cellulosispirillum alkaliphilum TaxID=3039283 RepID=UPI002A4E61EC|nr:transglycosylase SLT domain-containing protein [Chitinispirillales bacterium ANBcel5]
MHISSMPNQYHNLKNSPEGIKAVAQEFEAMFTSIMLRAMRSTVGEGALVPQSMAGKIYTEMLDNQYASLSARHSSLGLSNLLKREIKRHDTPEKTLNASREWREIPLWAKQRPATSVINTPSPTEPNTANSTLSPLLRTVNKWSDLIDEKAQKYNVDRYLVKAVMARESAGDPYAVSRAGAKGLMQLMDPTARELGVTNSFSPRENVDGGVRYLRQMLDMFNGNEQLALASYNAGPGNVRRYNGIPPFKETQHYVKAVLRMRNEARAAEME